MATKRDPMTVGHVGFDPYSQQTQRERYLPLHPVRSAIDEYVNRVVVERHEHDATLTFYRDGEKAGKRVAVLTVPLALLDKLAAKEDV